MKKLIITSAGFIGEVHIVYDAAGKLLLFDCQHAELTLEQTQWLKERLPIEYDEQTFLQHFGKAKLEFVPADYQVTFEMFWLKYNKKINKERAIKLWDKLSKTDAVKAYFGIVPYDGHLARNTWKTKCDPETYLRNKMWNNQWKE